MGRNQPPITSPKDAAAVLEVAKNAFAKRPRPVAAGPWQVPLWGPRRAPPPLAGSGRWRLRWLPAGGRRSRRAPDLGRCRGAYVQRATGDKKDGPHAALAPVPADCSAAHRRRHQCCRAPATRWAPRCAAQSGLPQRLLGVRQDQRGGILAQKLGARRQAVFGLAVAVGNGFQRQPFQPAARLQHGVGALHRPFARRAVKAHGAGRAPLAAWSPTAIHGGGQGGAER